MVRNEDEKEDMRYDTKKFIKKIGFRLLIIFSMFLVLPATWYFFNGVGRGVRKALVALTHYEMPEYPAPDMWIGFLALLLIALSVFFIWFIWVCGGWIQKWLERKINRKWGLGSDWEIARRERRLDREAAIRETARAEEARAARAADARVRNEIEEDPEQSYLQRIGMEGD